MLAPFTAQCVTSMDNGIGDGLVIGGCSMTFQKSFDKDSIDVNGDNVEIPSNCSYMR